jgi:hypothetical protein
MADPKEKLKMIDFLQERVSLSFEETQSIIDYILYSLENEWDRYTDRYITDEPTSEGIRSMDPKMYDLAMDLQKRLDERKG